MLLYEQPPYVTAWRILLPDVLINYLCTDYIPPFHQEFYVDDWSIRYPYTAKERVPLSALVVSVPISEF
jgi:hypothetical protein